MAYTYTNKRRRLKYSSTTPNKWADELPTELLGLIVKKLASNFMDIGHFKAVCSSWNGAARSYTSAPLPQYPGLMYPSTQWGWNGEGICFFSLAEKKVYKTEESQGFLGVGSFSGSSHGWLVMEKVAWAFSKINLFNPISRKSRTLSPFPRESPIRKIVLSSDPSCNNKFVVVVIHETLNVPTRLAFYQHGRGGENANAWTELEGSHDHYFDILLRNNGHLFALSRDHSIQVWDFGDTYNNNNPTKIMHFRPSMAWIGIHGTMMGNKKWLVESMDELLLVEREWLGDNSRGAEKFDVYKLNIAAKTWEKMECLGDCALFLAKNQPAMSLSTQKLPRLKENSIYFADEYHEYSHGENIDILVRGVFNFETKVVKEYCIAGAHKYGYSPAVWIVPSPW
ncbi:F-box protein SKIP23-like [Prunus yedoensis var. nudiflora]|uniref:F-box protein SKIP23-like n=1 Tax=Prunus yedoensis var. nudiflora TaxID=2094558 RepID=A0A314ZCT6_PRUYE|nr:F-box protein SKIP23-like [Prunus yedoensis var. nudiflora]